MSGGVKPFGTVSWDHLANLCVPRVAEGDRFPRSPANRTRPPPTLWSLPMSVTPFARRVR